MAIFVLQSITQIKFTRWKNDTGVHRDKIKTHGQERAQWVIPHATQALDLTVNPQASWSSICLAIILWCISQIKFPGVYRDKDRWWYWHAYRYSYRWNTGTWIWDDSLSHILCCTGTWPEYESLWPVGVGLVCNSSALFMKWKMKHENSSKTKI